MLSVLVKQGTTLHLSGEGGRDRRNFGGMGIIYFWGGRGELLLQSPEGGHVNYGPITRVIGS